ncbi:hypothetical protein DR64_3327 [Paraburkholderia xenovorans LB400]|uniref:Uncharacterized protein n=1 Tax=Achromobacter insolitus TaxID=217204 RepID=A0A6S7FF97_9BURK|nr:hypothetical protein DR64_3327 [Paraburkholderia xenovorans LB400]CAB3940026.1 hypothetical protein LMG6000_06376 [Achromobacter insolitus]CAB3948864.1 hypothetical protein LMG5997_06518 [Achromobacter insolitus]
MRLQLVYRLVSALSQNNFDHSSIVRAIGALLRRSLAHALLLKPI